MYAEEKVTVVLVLVRNVEAAVLPCSVVLSAWNTVLDSFSPG